MFAPEMIDRLARRLDEAHRTKTLIRMFTVEHPEMTIDDAYAIQRAWTEMQIAQGRCAGTVLVSQQPNSDINRTK